MILIATRYAETARRLCAVVEGRKVFAFTLEKCFELAKELRPEQVIVSARLGGTLYRAVDHFPALHQVHVDSDLVLATFAPSSAEIEEAVGLGAYGVIDLESADFYRKLDRIIFASSRRRRERRAVPASAIVLH